VARQTTRVKIIVYAGTKLLTGDDIAIGVLRYCEALAGSVVAEVIEIPIRKADGSLSRATLLVGPTSQMVAEDVESEWEEVIDHDVMRRLGERTRAQQPVAAIHYPSDDGDDGSDSVVDADRWESEF
jgi:hypothetical protein